MRRLLDMLRHKRHEGGGWEEWPNMASGLGADSIFGIQIWEALGSIWALHRSDVKGVIICWASNALERVKSGVPNGVSASACPWSVPPSSRLATAASSDASGGRAGARATAVAYLCLHIQHGGCEAGPPRSGSLASRFR